MSRGQPSFQFDHFSSIVLTFSNIHLNVHFKTIHVNPNLDKALWNLIMGIKVLVPHLREVLASIKFSWPIKVIELILKSVTG